MYIIIISYTPRYILLPYTTLFRSDVGGPTPGEIIRIDPESALRRRRVREVQPQITRNQIGTANVVEVADRQAVPPDRKSTRLNSSHQIISYAVFCLKKKKKYI